MPGQTNYDGSLEYIRRDSVEVLLLYQQCFELQNGMSCLRLALLLEEKGGKANILKADCQEVYSFTKREKEAHSKKMSTPD